MKAIVCKEFGPPSKLVLEDMEPLSPKKNEILIDIHAAGVNFPDTLIIKDMYQFKPALPFTPGNEVAGVVSAIGEEVTAYSIGDEVIAMPAFGGYAEQIVVSPSQASKKPVNMDFATAACFSTTYGTSHYGLKDKAQLKEGETVLILGASGGVGSAVVQLVKRRGAKVIAISSASKFEPLRQLGADQVLERGADLTQVLGDRSVDVAFDNVAGEGFGPILKVLKSGGRYASSGAIAGPLVTLDMRHFYLKDLTLIGCTGWDEPVFQNLISYIENGEIKPLVARTFDLKDMGLAQQLFLDKNHFGNFVLVPPAD